MIHIETRGAFVHATLDAPATRNALTDAMVAGLADAARLAQDTPTVRALVIRGAGDAFCAGGADEVMLGIISKYMHTLPGKR